MKTSGFVIGPGLDRPPESVALGGATCGRKSGCIGQGQLTESLFQVLASHSSSNPQWASHLGAVHILSGHFLHLNHHHNHHLPSPFSLMHTHAHMPPTHKHACTYEAALRVIGVYSSLRPGGGQKSLTYT